MRKPYVESKYFPLWREIHVLIFILHELLLKLLTKSIGFFFIYFKVNTNKINTQSIPRWQDWGEKSIVFFPSQSLFHHEYLLLLLLLLLLLSPSSLSCVTWAAASKCCCFCCRTDWLSKQDSLLIDTYIQRERERETHSVTVKDSLISLSLFRCRRCCCCCCWLAGSFTKSRTSERVTARKKRIAADLAFWSKFKIRKNENSEERTRVKRGKKVFYKPSWKYSFNISIAILKELKYTFSPCAASTIVDTLQC